jgi:Rieske Fe-S protein
MDRRGFLGQSALGALAVLAGSCTVADSITGPGLGSGNDVVVTLADYPVLATPGGIARISGVSPALALVNEGNGVYSAFSLSCPHAGSTVQISGSSFVCPNHGARFDANGKWTGGQRTSNLRSYATTFDAQAGTVRVTG